MNAIRLMGFKADGQAHRLWQRLYLGEEDDEKYVFFSLYPSITETNGRRWSNSEPTIYYCSKKHFYNIIVMFRDMGSIAYYVNIATPTMPLEKENEYGFIDLDLDVKLTEDKKVKILDQDEFEKNGEKYNYSEKLKKVSQDSVKVICEMIKENHPYFSDDYNRNKLNKYMESYRNVLGNKNI